MESEDHHTIVKKDNVMHLGKFMSVGTATPDFDKCKQYVKQRHHDCWRVLQYADVLLPLRR